MSTVILAPATTAGESTTFTVDGGESVTVGIYSATAGESPDQLFHIFAESPTGWNFVGSLGVNNRVVGISSPSTYKVTRTEGEKAFGVYLVS